MNQKSEVAPAGPVSTATAVNEAYPRKLRVVHCIDSLSAGGTELNLVRTIEKMDSGRFDISLLALKDRGALRERVARANIAVEVFDFPRLNSFAALKQAVRVVRWFRRLKPDVVHSHDRYTNLFVTPCARLAGVPLVIASRRWWTAMPRPIYRIGNQAAYRLAHRVIANSSAVARLMSEREGVPAARIVTVPNFVDEDAFVTMPEAALLLARRGFGIPDGALVITTVAVFRPEKDLETLIAALATLRQSYSNLHLLLVGSGPTQMALERAADAYGVRHYVHFPGFLNSPPNLHQYGDVSVLCSLHEGFPNSIVEAMAAGKAVVGTNVGGIPDAVENGLTGFLVAPHSSQALAEAIDCLLTNTDLRAKMGAAGRTKARAEYGAVAIIERLAELYCEAVPFAELHNMPKIRL